MKRKQKNMVAKKGATNTKAPMVHAKQKRSLSPKQSPVLAFNFRDAAYLSGLRTATIRKFLLAGKITRGKDGAFDIKKLLQLGSEEDEPFRSSMRRSPRCQKAYDQYWTAKAEEKELDLRVRKGEVLDRGVVLQELIARETVFKNRLLGLPDLFASRLVGCGSGEIKAICRESFMSLLKELVRQGSEAYQQGRN